MKKTIAAAAVALSALCASALTEIVLNRNGTTSSTQPMMIRSVYAVNQDSGNSSNETAAGISMKVTTSFSKYVQWFGSGSDFNAYDYYDLQLWYGYELMPAGSPATRTITPERHTAYTPTQIRTS